MAEIQSFRQENQFFPAARVALRKERFTVCPQGNSQGCFFPYLFTVFIIYIYIYDIYILSTISISIIIIIYVFCIVVYYCIYFFLRMNVPFVEEQLSSFASCKVILEIRLKCNYVYHERIQNT